MASFDPVGYVKDLQSAWNANDPDLFLRNYADVIEFQDPRASTTRRGKDAARASLKEWFGAFSDVQMRVKETTVTARTAAILYECKGRHTGDFTIAPGETVPATNKPATVDVAEFVTLDAGGLVTKDISLMDSAKLLMQLGLMPSGETANARGPASRTTIR